MNRVQFQAGLSMPEFLQRYGTEAQCRASVQAARWPSGFVCPACGGAARTNFERAGLRYWQCGRCDRQTSLISGTLFESSKLPLSCWFMAMQLLTQSKNNVSALELKRLLGVCYRSAWLMKHKILEAMRLAEAQRKLRGRVEIDDAYFGGEHSGGKTGRGTVNKVPFVAAIQTTDDGQPLYACLSQQRPTAEAMKAFAAQHIAPSAVVVTDGFSCYSAAILGVAQHQRIITGGGRAAAQLPQFKAVNTLLSNLKTGITGTYHSFNCAKYAHRYLAERQFRFNARFNLKTILSKLMHGLVAAQPSPERWLRAAEVPR